MIPYFNMISQDSNNRRRRANEAQAAEMYQGFRQAGRLLQAAANAVWRYRCRPCTDSAEIRRDASQSSPC